MLKYSYGEFLDNIAALRGITRSQGAKANTVVKFSLAEEMGSAVAIPKGSRLSVGNIFFATTEYGEIAIGETSVDILCQCTENGAKGNGFLPGEINTIVDSLPYVDNAANVTESSAGADVESDNDFAERIYLSNSAFSIAGSVEAYEYFVRQYSPLVDSVLISTDSDAIVDIRVLLKEGELPDSAFLNGLMEFLDGKRPLTDKVTAAAPSQTSYNITMTYYISSSDTGRVSEIQAAVADAVTAYRKWQNEKIGRDIIPDELIALVRAAGARRVVVTAPTYTVVADKAVPVTGTVAVTYGGVEND